MMFTVDWGNIFSMFEPPKPLEPPYRPGAVIIIDKGGDIKMSERPELPRYSGTDPTCVKCGYIGATTVYNDAGAFDPARFHNTLSRTCKCCGYAWVEAPLDKVSHET